jgi:UDP-N-acetylmuramoyl-tripeptide--D-alanyl-D-alanine ligase
MEPLSVRDIAGAIEAELVKGERNLCINSISTDSRSLKDGDLFFAIKGDRFNGHDFLKDALSSGASGVVFEGNELKRVLSLKESLFKKKIFIQVDDTIKALGKLAAFYRNRFKIPFIAVTGTCGKTTTKDIIFNLLSLNLKVLKNEGTKNNHIGLPVTLLQLDRNFDAAVLELGMNHSGEIDYLAGILKPHIGVITNVGSAHLEFVKDIDGVLKAKEELLRNLRLDDIAVVNGDDDRLVEVLEKYKFKKITFGMRKGCEFRATEVNIHKKITSFKLNNGTLFKLNLLGTHNIYNVLAAIATSSIFDIDMYNLRGALESFKPLNMRMKFTEINGMTIIDDTYNANPLSVKSAVDTLSGLNGNRKIAIFADMLELGGNSEQLHKDIGNYIAAKKIDLLITVGNLSRHIASAAKDSGMKASNIYNVTSKKEAADLLNRVAKPDDILLFKGSRLTKMEELINCFTTSYIH